jgi:ferric-dicitrate binding protein FerR (iron transport regulator)
MTREEIIRLTEKIISGEASEEEIQLYNRLYDSFIYRQQIPDSFFEEKQAVKEELRASIMEKTRLQTPVIKGGFNWRRWAAAAAVFILTASLSLYFFQHKINASQTATIVSQKERFKNDVPPGRVGAILTLGNGKTILLDSAGNGNIASQGAMSVVKRNDIIAYEGSAHGSEVVYNTMSTPKRRQFSLVLSDGTKVWLNAASSITYPTVFTGKDRKVSVSGEVYFEVSHRDDSPFIVEKGNVAIKVLGTHFNVNTYQDEHDIKITLLEGSVSVSNKSVLALIKPGQQARVSDDDKIKVLKDINIDDVMAWKNGLFHFEGIRIESLMQQLTRWYDIEVVYSKRTDELFYAEIPRNTNLSDVLKALELTGKVKFAIEGNKVIVNV